MPILRPNFAGFWANRRSTPDIGKRTREVERVPSHLQSNRFTNLPRSRPIPRLERGHRSRGWPCPWARPTTTLSCGAWPSIQPWWLENHLSRLNFSQFIVSQSNSFHCNPLNVITVWYKHHYYHNFLSYLNYLLDHYEWRISILKAIYINRTNVTVIRGYESQVRRFEPHSYVWFLSCARFHFIPIFL